MAIEDYAIMPLADYRAAITAIQNKNGHSGEVISSELVSEINAIQTGIDVSGTTATGADVLSGKKFYNSSGVFTTGTLIAGMKAASGSFSTPSNAPARKDITTGLSSPIKYIYIARSGTTTSSNADTSKFNRVGITFDGSAGSVSTVGLFVGQTGDTYSGSTYYDTILSEARTVITRINSNYDFHIEGGIKKSSTYNWIVLY